MDKNVVLDTSDMSILVDESVGRPIPDHEALQPRCQSSELVDAPSIG